MAAPEKCAGCGKGITSGVYGNGRVEELSGLEEHALPFCLDGNQERAAKRSCVMRARQRLKVCVLCGDSLKYDWPVRVVCGPCEGTYQVGLDYEEGEKRNRTQVELRPWELRDEAWRRSTIRTSEAEMAFVGALARALDPDADVSSHSACVTVTLSQKEALDGLLETLRAALDEARAQGHRAGSSLLRKLADGKTSVAEYDDATARRSR